MDKFDFERQLGLGDDKQKAKFTRHIISMTKTAGVDVHDPKIKSLIRRELSRRYLRLHRSVT